MADILLVEDDPVVSKLVMTLLTRNGHAVLQAMNGRHAREIIETEDFDLIITDFMMAGIDGRELCEGIRRESRCRAVPILMTTGRPDCAGAPWVEALGIDVMEKPIDGRELLERVARLTARPERRSERTSRSL